MSKAFRRGLALHLEDRKHAFWSEGGGGCPTCGDGGEGEIDFHALIEEIDAFSASFRDRGAAESIAGSESVDAGSIPAGRAK